MSDLLKQLCDAAQLDMRDEAGKRALVLATLREVKRNTSHLLAAVTVHPIIDAMIAEVQAHD